VLKLRTYKQDLERKPAIELQAVHLRKWIEKLPRLNFDESVAALDRVLDDINRTSLSPAQRFSALEVVSPEVDQLIAGLPRHYAALSFPMSYGKRELYRHTQGLLEAMSIGYNAVITELVRGDAEVDASHTRMRDALLQAVQYTGQRILHAYSVYENAPEGCWGELHRIYQYAEQKGMATVRVEHLADFSIRDAYLRIVMLGLANPYHLMQGEAIEVYAHLRKWCLAVRLVCPEEVRVKPGQPVLGNSFVVDLASEAPPRFCLSDEEEENEHIRVLRLEELVRIVTTEITRISKRERLDITERLYRDFLRRLRNAWGSRQQRKQSRDPCDGVADIAAGLASSHYFIGGETDFTPEDVEIALHGSAFQRDQELSLVPLEHEEWKHGETQEKLAKGILKPRSFGFDVDAKEDDIWKKANTTAIQQKTGLEMSVEERLLKTLFHLTYRNCSPGGTGLEYTGEKGLRLRVGEIVALRHQEKDGAWQWSLSAVRWLYCGEGESGIQVGLHHVGGGGRAVAVRGIGGEGAGSHYLRALLLEMEGQQSLVVPTGRFDSGSRLLLNDGIALWYADLDRLLQTSKTFSQFLISMRAPDGDERKHIVESLYKVLQ
jgi:cyclic-di-GMP-binding protein